MTSLFPHAAESTLRSAEYRRQRRLRELLHTALGALWTWNMRWSSRRALADIADDTHLLADIGISRRQARRETDKPFWRS